LIVSVLMLCAQRVDMDQMLGEIVSVK